MPFLSAETSKALEGNFITFIDGVERKLKLNGHTSKVVDGAYGEYTQHTLKVTDMETGDDKEFRGKAKFMTALNKINSKLEEGSVIIVTPSADTYEDKDGNQKDTMNFLLTIEGADSDF